MNSMYIGAMDKARLSDILAEARRCTFIKVVLGLVDVLLFCKVLAMAVPLGMIW